jgi:hypothetical protein
MYGDRVRDFPAQYEATASVMDYKNDPYARDKFKIQRLNLKIYISFAIFTYTAIKWRESRVSEYDRLKRYEQRAMQNKEADEVFQKKARFILFDT